MNRRTARGNRLGLILVAVALLAAGGYALWRHQDGGAVLSDALRAEAAEDATLWTVVAAVAVLIGVLCLRWLLVQFRRVGLRRLSLEERTAHGETVLHGAALTGAVQSQAEAVPGVQSAGAVLVRRRRQLHLHLHLSVARDIDLERLIAHLRAALLPDARSALEEPDLPLVVRLSTGGRRGRAPRVV